MSFPASFNLANLNGRNGFVINGVDVNYFSGFSVSSAGDFNGDGFDDVLIGSFGEDASTSTSYTIESYIIFGSAQGFSSHLDLNQLNSADGITFNKVFSETDIQFILGYAVSSAGDINGDGFDDILIGSEIKSPNSSAPNGEIYVVLGNAQNFNSGLNLSKLDGTNGFVVNVPEVFNSSYGGTNFSFPFGKAGDVNGDGFDDVLVGFPKSSFFFEDINGNGLGEKDGKAYIILGSDQGFSPSVNLSSPSLDETYRIDLVERSSQVVNTAGDFNGDGLDDFLITGRGKDPKINRQTDEIYLIFGSHQDLSLDFNIVDLDGRNGLIINDSFLANDVDEIQLNLLSVASAVGDFNGDGFDDIIIGQSWADSNGKTDAGKTYVVFGSEQPSPSIDLNNIDGSNGFVLNGIDEEERSGSWVSSAGDFNGDGLDDILIGAPGKRRSNSNSNSSSAGKTYIVFGNNQGFNPSFDLAKLDGSNGFILNGIDEFDLSGYSVSSAGDINGDGFDDIVIGAPLADPNSKSSAGETYVVLGRATHTAIEWNTETGIVSSFGISLSAGKASTTPIGRSIQDKNWELQTTGDFNGDGQADVLLRHALAGQLLAWTMAPGGQSIQSEAIIGRELTDTNWSIGGAGDLNGDGNTDLILHNQATDEIIAWYMDGKGGIQSEALIGRSFGDNNWAIEVMADFNDDGKADIVLRNRLSGQHLLWEMDGATILAETLIGRDIPDQNWHIEGARDFDNNGTVDLFLRHRGIGQGLLWSMADQTTIASEKLISNVPTRTSQLVF